MIEVKRWPAPAWGVSRILYLRCLALEGGPERPTILDPDMQMAARLVTMVNPTTLNPV